MANISQEVNIEMLEKLADGSYKKKNPSTKASQVKFADGSTVESHKADHAIHGVYEDAATGDKYKWGIENGLVYLEKVGG